MVVKMSIIQYVQHAEPTFFSYERAHGKMISM